MSFDTVRLGIHHLNSLIFVSQWFQQNIHREYKQHEDGEPFVLSFYIQGGKMLLAAHLKNKNSTNMQLILDKKHFSYASERQPGSLFHVVAVASSDSLQLPIRSTKELLKTV